MRSWRPYKASKAEVLTFYEEMEVVTIRSLMDRFGYSFNGAQGRIYLLYNEGLVEHLIQSGSWGLTQKDGKCDSQNKGAGHPDTGEI